MAARRIISRALSSVSAKRRAPNPDSRILWVSYADPQTVRRRLVGVSQQVRNMLRGCEAYSGPLPELIFPTEQKRIRHGFWFMQFADPDSMLKGQAELNQQPFRSRCGSIAGTILIDQGRKPLQLRTMLQLDEKPLHLVEKWLHNKFGTFGRIDEVRLPRLQCNWDGGMAFVHFNNPDDAYDALQQLDGTPSCILGCNMFVNFACPDPLYTGPQSESDEQMLA